MAELFDDVMPPARPTLPEGAVDPAHQDLWRQLQQGASNDSSPEGAELEECDGETASFSGSDDASGGGHAVLWEQLVRDARPPPSSGALIDAFDSTLRSGAAVQPPLQALAVCVGGTLHLSGRREVARKGPAAAAARWRCRHRTAHCTLSGDLYCLEEWRSAAAAHRGGAVRTPRRRYSLWGATVYADDSLPNRLELCMPGEDTLILHTSNVAERDMWHDVLSSAARHCTLAQKPCFGRAFVRKGSAGGEEEELFDGYCPSRRVPTDEGSDDEGADEARPHRPALSALRDLEGTIRRKLRTPQGLDESSSGGMTPSGSPSDEPLTSCLTRLVAE
eukprot:TRINITY_DN2019_c0_g1_i1.p1 TRINITY_DN2019_c0_g1~~TRINITY_DN2019_c0_g1_i1.p1  ORF type:complete len:363 (+),score=110.61 TRINITY_DN2019_c0_g1_i1:90-1091(+)